MTTKSATWRPGATVCRCCLAEGCYKDISTEYFWMGKREVYSEMLHHTFDVSIAYSQAGGPNSNSRLICEPCISRLRDASEFKRQVQECEKTFMQYLEPGSSATTEVEVSKLKIDKHPVKVELVKEEKGESEDDNYALPDDFLDDDDDDDIDNQPLTKLASKVPKKEEEPIDLLDFLKPPKAEKRKSASKVKSSPAKKAKNKEAKASASKVKTPVEKKKKGEDEDVARDTARATSRIILKHSTAYPFTLAEKKWVKCIFCLKAFEDPIDFRNHVDFGHKSVDRSTSLIDKDIIRIDITDLRCKQCAEAFDTLDALTKHLKCGHQLDIEESPTPVLVPMKLVIDRFDCVLCNRKFTGISELYKHSGTHFERFICDVCGKNYETARGLENHTTSNHSKLGRHYCRKCKGYFPTKEAKKVHVRENKPCMPFCCVRCKERFLCWEAREEHMVELHGHTKRTYPCTECEQIFEKRTLYYLHFKAKHTSEFKCQYCEQRFSTRRDLNNHTFQHTGERPYQCSVCDKTFATDKNLRQHVLIHDDSKKHCCPVCSRLFPQITRFRDHIKLHHPSTFDDMFS